MSAAEGQLVSADGTVLHSLTWEPNADPGAVVCLAHGLGEHAGRHARVAEAYCDAGIAVLAFDHRGHGRSPGRRGHGSYAGMLDDLDAAIARARSLWPNAPLFLQGNSMGGALVLLHGQRREAGLAGIVAIASAFRPAFEPPAWKVRLGRLLAGVLPSLTLGNELDLDAISRDPAVVKAYRDDPLTHRRISVQLGVDLLDDGLAALRDAAGLRVPTLLVHGTGDRLTSCAASREFAAACDAADLLELDGFYHEPHNDPGGDAVVRQISEWILATASRAVPAPRS